MRTTSLILPIVLGWSCVVFSFSAAGQESSTNKEDVIEKRVEFFQKNFSKFVPVQFRKGKNNEAAIQILPVSTNMFEYEGVYYCGFRFTIPEWLDGDFDWFYLQAKTETNKDFTTHTLQWFIVPETGRSHGFEFYRATGFSEYRELKAQFPYTHVLTTQSLDQERLIPGKTYAIWFECKERNLPNIAFAMTIDSERGRKEFGALPLR